MRSPNQAEPAYGGRARPFSFALEPLDLASWIPRDAAYAEQIAEKQRLFDMQPDDVFFARPESLVACRELEAQLVERGFIRPADRTDSPALPALWRASRQVQSDLLILQQTAAGAWHLTAGSLSFPSKWHLMDKAGKRLDAIHAPVPGFGPGARNANLMARMFDKLQPTKPMLRHNWSLDSQAVLHRPLAAPLSGPNSETPSLIRIERQTLVKLPKSKAIVFGIHIALDPFDLLKGRPELCRAIISQLQALTPDQLQYKSFLAGLEPFIAELASLANCNLR